MFREPKRNARPSRRVQGRRPRLEVLESRELLTGSYSVTTLGDSGPGSLRAAIIQANGDGLTGTDTISFSVPTTPGVTTQTIALQTALPAITRPIVIDGSTQPLPNGSPASTVPHIAIDGKAVAGGADGLVLTGAAGSTIRGLAITDFAASATGGGGRGILLTDGGQDSIVGDYLGIAVDGVTAAPNADGIEVDSANNTIGGTNAAGVENLISGNTVDGIFLSGISATGNIVAGNLIGTDVSGVYSVGNIRGIEMSASFNVIGGSFAGTGNVIAGNVSADGKSGFNILLDGVATNDVIEGNNIGVDITGGASPGNVYGIYFGTPGGSASDNVSQDVVGGTVAGAGNTISGNFLGITGNATTLFIGGNKIGTDAGGTVAIPNGDGLLLGSSATTIGGTTAATRNVISGNSAASFPGAAGTGLDLTGSTDTILGNEVGLNAAGSAALPNVIGMNLHVASSTIGGTAQGAGNIVAGNSGDGIRLNADNTVNGVLTDSNVSDAVQGNVIGLSPGNVQGNGGNGINLLLPAPTTPLTTPLALNDSIGGTTFGSGNFIIGNAGAGIAVANSVGALTGLSFRSNSISINGKLGIDLFSNGAPFANSVQITGASPVTAGSTTITGTFQGTPGLAYQVDFFASAAGDPSGFGQGQFYLGSATLTPGTGGLASFSQSFATILTGQPVVSATVTDPLGNTSEFSANFPIAATAGSADLAVTQTAAATATVGGILVITETVTNNGPAAANNVVLIDALPTSLVNAAPSTTAGTASVSGSNIVTANLGTIASGQSVTVTIPVNASVATTLTNTVGVSSTTADPNFANNQATATVVVQPVVAPTADLAITEVASSAAPAIGSNLTFVVTVTNNGPGSATNATVSDFLPAGATFVSATTSTGVAATMNGTLVTANLGTIASGATATVTVIVRPTVAGTLTNAANVSGNQFDPTSGNNSTTVTVTVPPVATTSQATLTLTQTTSSPTGTIGQILLFNLTVTNTGPDTAPGVTLVDAVPTGTVVLLAAPSQGPAATFAPGFIEANIGSLAAGASATLIVAVVPTTSAPVVNFAAAIPTGVVSPAPAFSQVSVPAASTALSVTGLLSTGGGRQIIANFSTGLNPATATNRANFRLYSLGKNPRVLTAKDKPVAINSITYISPTHGVVITPSRSLVASQYYLLVIVGSGITDTTGHQLIGTPGGAAGSNYTNTFQAGALTAV